MPRISLEAHGLFAHCTLAQVSSVASALRDITPSTAPNTAGDLVQPFLKRMQAIGDEIGSQMAVTAATGIECSTGGDACRIAKNFDAPMANRIRAETRRAGKAKHNLRGLALESASSQSGGDSSSDAQPAAHIKMEVDLSAGAIASVVDAVRNMLNDHFRMVCVPPTVAADPVQIPLDKNV